MTTVDLTPAGDGTLLFMHVPKTGGTTLRKSLGDAYPAHERAYIYGDGVPDTYEQVEFRALPSETLADFRLVLGHYRFGLHEVIPGPSLYAATVREPIDRVISVYGHYRHHKGRRFRFMSRSAREADPVAKERAVIEERGIGLEEWVFERQRREVDNQMVRQLAGQPAVRFGECDERLLETALRNVQQRFAMLLVHEEITLSVARLSERIGRPLSLGKPLNVNRRRAPTDQVDRRLRERIAALNHLDVRLYAAARERLLGSADVRRLGGDAD